MTKMNGLGSLVFRLGLRGCTLVVRRLRIPAHWVGFTVLKAVSVESYRKNGMFLSFDVLEPGFSCDYPLPANIRCIEDLPPGELWGRSFRDVTRKVVVATYVATLKNCRIATYYDEWDNEFSIVVDKRFWMIQLKGLEFNGGKGLAFRGGHASVLRSMKSGPAVLRGPEVAWIFENWSANYYHWVVYHLPKVLLLKRFFPGTKIIIPKKNNLYPVIRATLSMLGYDDRMLIAQSCDTLCVEELRVIGLDSHNPHLLRELALLFNGYGDRIGEELIYISRKNAKWRRITNEDDLIDALLSKGFRVLIMEELSFHDQLKAVRNARVILSPHGAGLTNIMFARRGIEVVEIINPDFPNSDYYALACSLGHRYWLYEASDIDDQAAIAFHDLYVPIEPLMVLLDAVLSCAAAPQDGHDAKCGDG